MNHRHSDLELQLQVQDQCLQGHTDLKASDFENILNFYIAGDTTGNSSDLTSLESFPLRLTIVPSKKTLPLSEDLGENIPQFPSQFEVPDLHFGLPEIGIAKSLRFRLRPTLWIENICQRNCQNTFCPSLCDYTHPFSGKFELYEIQKDKNLLVSEWFDGGVMTPQFQGEFLTAGTEIEKESIQENKNYLLRFIMIDPKLDFEEFKMAFTSRIGSLQRLPADPIQSKIPELPSVQPIGESNKIPNLPRVPELNLNTAINQSLERVLQTFNSYFNYRSWPPYYDGLCLGAKCSPLSHQPYYELEMEYSLNSTKNLNDLNNVKVIKTRRKSFVRSNYEIQSPPMPYVKCPF